MSRLKTLALAPAIVLALPQVVAAAPAPLARVEAHLQAVDTMTANFTQTDRRGEIRTGTLILKRPGRIRFEYQGSPRMLLVGDGKQVYFIDYQVSQVSRLPIANSPYSVLLSAHPDLGRLAHVVRDDPQSIVIEARDPKKPQFGTITLAFAKGGGPAGLTLEGWTVLDAQNNRTTIRLSNQRFNVGVADSAFRFEDPRGRGPKG